MKGTSEAAFSAALREAATELHMLFWKPPDDARNWKPADFFAWRETAESPDLRASFARPYFFEVKQTTNLGFATIALRPTQRVWLEDGSKIGISCWIAVWWKNVGIWQFWNVNRRGLPDRPFAVKSALPDATPANLASVIKGIMRGEVVG